MKQFIPHDNWKGTPAFIVVGINAAYALRIVAIEGLLLDDDDTFAYVTPLGVYGPRQVLAWLSPDGWLIDTQTGTQWSNADEWARTKMEAVH